MVYLLRFKDFCAVPHCSGHNLVLGPRASHSCQQVENLVLKRDIKVYSFVSNFNKSCHFVHRITLDHVSFNLYNASIMKYATHDYHVAD